MTKHLYITNEYGKVQFTDEESSYFFLLRNIPLSTYYWNTSEYCDCTWADGVKTTTTYNYCVNHPMDSKLVFVLHSNSDTPIRLAAAPLDFVGNPSFHLSVTGCTKEQADAIRLFIFSGVASDFTDGKCGMAFYDNNGRPLYNSSWLPLKIVGHGANASAWNSYITYNENYGVILNSGYRNASTETVTTGTWRTLTSNSSTTASSFVLDSSGIGYSPPWFISGGSYNSNYKNSEQTIDTFPVDITYQGYILSKNNLAAMTYTAKAPIKTDKSTRAWTEYTQEYKVVTRWDSCATETTEWDSCAYTTMEYDSCASTRQVWDNCATTIMTWDNCATTNIITGECQAGIVDKCQAGFKDECVGGMVTKCQGGPVTKCMAGWKDTWEWVDVTTDYKEDTVSVYPYMDNPSLMYGMEAYPDGTLFTRSSGISTVGVVDLTNYF